LRHELPELMAGVHHRDGQRSGYRTVAGEDFREGSRIEAMDVESEFRRERRIEGDQRGIRHASGVDAGEEMRA
jgi:hypothetical protein